MRNDAGGRHPLGGAGLRRVYGCAQLYGRAQYALFTLSMEP